VVLNIYQSVCTYDIFFKSFDFESSYPNATLLGHLLTYGASLVEAALI